MTKITIEDVLEEKDAGRVGQEKEEKVEKTAKASDKDKSKKTTKVQNSKEEKTVEEIARESHERIRQEQEFYNKQSTYQKQLEYEQKYQAEEKEYSALESTTHKEQLSEEQVSRITRTKIINSMIGGIQEYASVEEEEQFKYFKQFNQIQWWLSFQINNQFGYRNITQ